jgi:mediator of RNA polymerase II transcription subunit 12
VDLTLDGSDATLGRYGNIPRNGGSRLKLEISKDSKNTAFVESPKPTSVAAPTWRPSLPPRGRPRIHFNVPSASNLSPRPSQDERENDAIIRPMPLPARPGQYVPPTREKSRMSLGNSAKKEARPKPYVLEVPTAAPHYSPNGMSLKLFRPPYSLL